MNQAQILVRVVVAGKSRAMSIRRSAQLTAQSLLRRNA